MWLFLLAFLEMIILRIFQYFSAECGKSAFVKILGIFYNMCKILHASELRKAVSPKTLYVCVHLEKFVCLLHLVTREAFFPQGDIESFYTFPSIPSILRTTFFFYFALFKKLPLTLTLFSLSKLDNISSVPVPFLCQCSFLHADLSCRNILNVTFSFNLGKGVKKIANDWHSIPDQINMAVVLWYLVHGDFSSVR